MRMILDRNGDAHRRSPVVFLFCFILDVRWIGPWDRPTRAPDGRWVGAESLWAVALRVETVVWLPAPPPRPPRAELSPPPRSQPPTPVPEVPEAFDEVRTWRIPLEWETPTAGSVHYRRVGDPIPSRDWAG
ncbi:hypothetical protein [Thermoflexus hugenholtzii]|uniref:Uncharacterized protein n=1 Tax=Thermoflexus hugenholtzii JAD2 TaxID=877466 RepID=A0A212RR60_9CHLR|nr:hypothetical protein [Thermoflexus hugenholtzii]SNB75103.1 hypothetical protein SAMN02746019_00018570 [Thermoflexus hugenholtzii JAD2]